MDKIYNFVSKIFAGGLPESDVPLLKDLKQLRDFAQTVVKDEPVLRKKMAAPGLVPRLMPKPEDTPFSPELSPKDKKAAINALKAILALYKDANFSERVLLVIGAICAIIHGATFPILAVLLGNMSKTFFSEIAENATDNTTKITQDINNTETFHTREEFADYVSDYSLYYYYLSIAVFFAAFIQTWTWEWVAENLLYRRRQQFIFKLCREELSWLNRHKIGNVVIKLADDLERIREGTGHNFSMVFEFLSIFGFGAAIGLLTNMKLTLVFFTSIPVYFTRYAIIGEEMVLLTSGAQKKFGEASNAAAEVFSSIRAVCAFGTELKEKRRYENLLNEATKEGTKLFHILGLSLGILYVIAYGVYAFGFYYAVTLIINKQTTPGEIYMVFFSVTISIFAATNILPFISSITSAKGSSLNVDSVFQENPKIDPYSTKGKMPRRSTGQVEISSLVHKFSGCALEFDKVCMQMNPREVVAIVGPDSGKSALVDFLLRFHDPIQGNIRYDNYDLRDLNLQWVRQQIAVVQQSPVFFDGPIMDNLSGASKATREQLVNLSKLVGAHSFIMNYPKKYETKIGDSGVRLSACLKQRLGIVRALARKPRVLILDDALSNIDTHSSEDIIDNIRHRGIVPTTIIISSKAARCRKADKIYVIENGKLEQQGTYKELCQGSEHEKTFYRMLQDESVIDKLDVSEESDSKKCKHEDSEEDDEDIDDSPGPIGIKKYETKITISKKMKGSKKETAPLLPKSDDDDDITEEEIEIAIKTLYHIYEIVRDQKWQIFLGVAGCGLSGAVNPMLAYYLGNIFSTFMRTEGLQAAALFWAAMIALLAIAAGIGYWMRSVFLSMVGQILALRLRQYSFLNIIRQPMSWFDKPENSPVRLYSRIACEVPFVQSAVGPKLGMVFTPLFSFLVAGIITLVYSWQLGLIALTLFPIIFFTLVFQARIQHKGLYRLAEIREDMVKQATKLIQSMWNIQAMSLAIEMCLFFEYRFLRALQEGRKQALTYAIIVSVLKVIIFLVLGGMITLASHLVRDETLNPSAFFTIFFVIVFASISLGPATTFIPEYCKGIISAKGILELINLESSIDPLDKDGHRPEIIGKIEFRNINFSYKTEVGYTIPVLYDLSLLIPAKKTFGIVGAAGCGKSTLLALLIRHYEACSGEILIDDINIKDINLAHLRANIGYVPHDPRIFNDTISNNIAYGLPDDMDPKIVPGRVNWAAVDSNASSFIKDIEGGMDFVCGENGNQLFPGEKQLLGLARAIVRNPSILLLDDPTTALSAREEKSVLGTLKFIVPGRTVIIATKSPKLAEVCDHIAIMINGSIAEVGEREELLKNKNSHYYKFANQTGFHDPHKIKGFGKKAKEGKP